MPFITFCFFRTFIEVLATGKNFDVDFASGKSKRTLLHMAAKYVCSFIILPIEFFFLYYKYFLVYSVKYIVKVVNTVCV